MAPTTTLLDDPSPSPAVQDPMLTLIETIEDLSMARTVEQVAAVVRSAARRITGADGVAFVLRDGDKCWYMDEDAIGPLWKGLRFPMSACISGWAMLNGETAVIPDIYLDSRIPHDAYRPTFVKSLVVTPVRPRDPLAAIGAYWSVERQPLPEEIANLQVMARATAAALENALMYVSLNEALERRKFLIQELDHRCKNTLAAVQSIADQTLRRSASPGDFAEAFNGRLGALARAHELLTRESWGRARMSDVLSLSLAPFGGVDGRRIAADGPELNLSPETSVAMQMAFYELAQNAAKYGSLSTDDGQVDIAWSVDMEPATRRMELTWLEKGGPAVSSEPIRRFGTRLIERGVARELNGEALISFQPDGLRFTLTAPLSHRLSLA